jgi:YidC/Oxa1 family membrane protein insertase
MERRALIALALSFVVFMAFMYYGEMTKRPAAPPAVSQKAPAPATAPAPAPAAGTPAPGTPAPVKAVPTRPAKDVVVETPSYKAVFTELGGRLKSFQLKKYKDSLPYKPIYHFNWARGL